MRYRLLFFFAIITACGGAQLVPEKKEEAVENPKPADISAKACLNLVNGIVTSDFSAVVNVTTASGFCTGTFVSDSTLITAAHCANQTRSGGLKYRNIEPLEIIHYGKLSNSKSNVWEDLMIVVFPPNTSRSFVSLHNMAPQVGNRITLVGYGQTDLLNDNSPDGKKRKGSNVISRIQENNTAIVYDAPKSHAGLGEGEKSMTGRGDSGGPVFIEGGGLVGIVSRGSLNPDLVEYDVNLFSVESLKLMESAVTRGAKIGGIDFVRSLVDPAGTLKGASPSPMALAVGQSADSVTSCQ